MHARGERLHGGVPRAPQASGALPRARRARRPRSSRRCATSSASCALALPGGDEPTAADYAKLLLQIKDRPDYALLQTVLLRSLQQARYRPDNVGHFGLSYEAYAHFTSPIRRYPDLVVHRAIKAVLARPRVQAVGGMSWSELGVHCSLTERRADDATRDVENWLKCYFMQDKVGESFDGTISGVTSFGIFVTLDGLNIDGLVHVTELGRDYFHFDAGRHAMIGERSGRIFQLAGRVRVTVARVDLETAKIDFTLADDRRRGAARRGVEVDRPDAPPRKESPRPAGREALTHARRWTSSCRVRRSPRPTIAAIASLAGAQGIHALAGGGARLSADAGASARKALPNAARRPASTTRSCRRTSRATAFASSRWTWIRR